MDYKGQKLRHELKYFINYNEYTGLKNRLRFFMAQDYYAVKSGSYHVRSLYFDDAYDSALYDKNSGVADRVKYRIRIYNKSDKIIKLERKSKYGQYISKKSGVLTKQQYYNIMNNDISFMMHSDNSVFNDVYLQMKNNLLSPRVIVDYEREAYILNISEIRITFDKTLQAGINSTDIFDENLVAVNVFKGSVMIMEVKYNDFLPDNIRALLHLTSHENSAASKYVMCRETKLAYNGGLYI